MSFRNFDNYYQDYDYDSDPSPSPPFRRSVSPFSTRSLSRRATSSSPRRTRPVIGEDGWEVFPPELLDPSNWGLPPSSLDFNPKSAPTHQPADQEPKMYPGSSSRMFPGRSGTMMQFYPDHDPDLINTNQLDGMPYVLQTSNIPPVINTAPKIVLNEAYNASFYPGKLSFSRRWEQGLLEMAHSNPETLRNYSRIPPGKRGGFKFFGELRGDDEGGQGGIRSSGGAVSGQNFGAFGNSGGRGQTLASTPGYSSTGPGQPLASAGDSGSTPGRTVGGPCQPLYGRPPVGSSRARGRGNTLLVTHETLCTLGDGYGCDASSKAAASDATLRREAPAKAEQMRNKADSKTERHMKEDHRREKAAPQRVKLAEEEAEKEAEKKRFRQEKLERDREARNRKPRDWGKKSRDVRSLAAEAAARRNATTKDIQHERVESLRKKRTREEREKEVRARARAGKKREEKEDEEKYLLSQQKRERGVEVRNAKARQVGFKSKHARQFAREAAERRFAAMEREKQAEQRSKVAQHPKPMVRRDEATQSLICEDCGKRFSFEAQASVHADKSGHQNFAAVKSSRTTGLVKPSARPTATPVPAKKAQPFPKLTSAKVPEKKTLPSCPAPVRAPARAPAKTVPNPTHRAPHPPPSPSESERRRNSRQGIGSDLLWGGWRRRLGRCRQRSPVVAR